MWYYVAENPWPLAGAFGLVALGFLIAMKVTADGKYLVRALIVLGLAAGVLIVEQLLVTDAERIESTVKNLIHALSRSDADGVTQALDDHVTFSIRNDTLGNELDLEQFREKLKDLTFDGIYVSRLSTSSMQQSGRGSAEFKASAAGTYQMNGVGYNFAGNSEWSLGFRRLPSGEWKINRITAMSFPLNVVLPFMRARQPSTAGAPR